MTTPKDQWKEILETAFYDSNPDAPCGEWCPLYQDIEKCVAILLEKVRRETIGAIGRLITPESYETPEGASQTLSNIQHKLIELTNIKQMTNQWKEVDERFDKEFTCVVTYEKWPDEEEQRLREPQYKFKDFPNTNPKIIKNFLHSELEKVRQEAEDNMRKRCVEALPKPMKIKPAEDTGSEAGWGMVTGFNDCINQATQNINNLDKE